MKLEKNCLVTTVTDVALSRHTPMISRCILRTDTYNQFNMTSKLRNIEHFLQDNRLTINTGKTKILETMVKQKREVIVGEGPTIKVSQDNGETTILRGKKTCLILGGTLQDGLSWRAHLTAGKDCLANVLRRKLGSLKHIGKNMDRKSWLLLANRFIQSKLIYLIGVWGGAHQTIIDCLQKIQNNTARFVTGCGSGHCSRTVNGSMSGNWRPSTPCCMCGK